MQKQAQKVTVLALVAGLLVLQLTPPVLARRTNTGTETATATAEEDDTGLTAECIISIANFVITQINAITTAVAAGLTACTVPCGAMGDAAACAACIIAVIPPIPLIPTTLAGCEISS